MVHTLDKRTQKEIFALPNDAIEADFNAGVEIANYYKARQFKIDKKAKEKAAANTTTAKDTKSSLEKSCLNTETKPEGEVIDLTCDNELSQKIVKTMGADKYKIIQAYILDVLPNQPIKLSDGNVAIVDKRDQSTLLINLVEKNQRKLIK